MMYAWVVFLDRDPTDEEFNALLSQTDALGKVKLQRAASRDEQWRMMVARLLPHWMMKSRGVTRDKLRIDQTHYGKPYVASPVLAPSLAFNIAYQNHLVGLCFAEVGNGIPERMGIDIMELKPPTNMRLFTYIGSLSSKLTALERSFLHGQPDHVALRRLMMIWTLKESYTKAIGMGGNFDFSRIETDVPRKSVRLDGQPLHGWEFRCIKIAVGSAARTGVMIGEEYQLTCALYHGHGQLQFSMVEDRVPGSDWIKFLEIRHVNTFVRELQREVLPIPGAAGASMPGLIPPSQLQTPRASAHASGSGSSIR